MGCSAFGNFTAEIALHFKGLKNIDKPHVFIFPELIVCLDCGIAEFVVSDKELSQLKDSRAASG